MQSIRGAFIRSTMFISFIISYLLYLIVKASLGSNKLAFIIALLQMYPYFLIEYLSTGQIISLFFQSILLLLFAVIVLLIAYIIFSFYKTYKFIKNFFY